MQIMQKSFLRQQHPDQTFKNPQWRETLRVQTVSIKIQPKWKPQQAYESSWHHQWAASV
ncbi:hypothetical protein D910_06235, partial [Dendroctonus ponderosae]